MSLDLEARTTSPDPRSRCTSIRLDVPWTLLRNLDWHLVVFAGNGHSTRPDGYLSLTAPGNTILRDVLDQLTGLRDLLGVADR